MESSNLIKSQLDKLVREQSIDILLAVESGSRAWGFASPDSDYDIRFIYRKDVNSYMTLWERRDTLEFMTEDHLDGAGWDIDKALTLIAKSNSTLHEWLFSPIVYDQNEAIFIYPN
jgi:predicted nucleotidyltransferase